MLQNLGTRLLCLATLAAAVGLAILVLQAPYWLIENPDNRLLAVFANDNTVRRTALASALGLGVTALVFFRPGKGARDKKSAAKRSAPVNIPGA